MSNALTNTSLVVEGMYGLPVATSVDHGPRRGTIEWLLEAVERHARAEQDALAEYEFVAEASADPVIALVMQTKDSSVTVQPRRGPFGWGMRAAPGHGEPNPTWIPLAHRAVRKGTQDDTMIVVISPAMTLVKALDAANVKTKAGMVFFQITSNNSAEAG